MQVFNPNDRTVAMLEPVARSLVSDLCGQFVFVGAVAACFLIMDLAVCVLRAPEFIATELEALYGRGDGDYLFRHHMRTDTLIQKLCKSCCMPRSAVFEKSQ